MDLIFCHDCLVHLPEQLVLAALENMRMSGRYLMTTTFYTLSENFGCATGGWREINLQLPPYSLPQPLLIIPEQDSSERVAAFDKSIGVWDLHT